MALSGWCGQRGIPNHAGCRWDGCACECGHPHLKAAQPLGSGRVSAGDRTSVRDRIGTQSGPESAGTDRGLPITHAKDVTG